MTAIEVLEKARERLSDPAHWCKCVLAEDTNGNYVEPTDPKAVSWCALGAIDWAARGMSLSSQRMGAKHYLRQSIMDLCCGNSDSIPLYNDYTSHTGILRAFDDAITLAKLVEEEMQCHS